MNKDAAKKTPNIGVIGHQIELNKRLEKIQLPQNCSDLADSQLKWARTVVETVHKYYSDIAVQQNGWVS